MHLNKILIRGIEWEQKNRQKTLDKERVSKKVLKWNSGKEEVT